MSADSKAFNPPTDEFQEICARVDGYLKSITASEDYIDLSADNEDLLQLAFVARGIFRELIVPSKELVDAITGAEVELKNLAQEFGESESKDELDEDSDEGFEEEAEED